LVVWCILVEIVDIGCTVVLGAICLDFWLSVFGLGFKLFILCIIGYIVGIWC
jgi:hypothetical protein